MAVVEKNSLDDCTPSDLKDSDVPLAKEKVSQIQVKKGQEKKPWWKVFEGHALNWIMGLKYRIEKSERRKHDKKSAKKKKMSWIKL